jgi:hypothetical protein
MDQAVRETVVYNLQEGLGILARKTKHIHKDSEGMDRWIDAVLDHVERQLETEKFADGKVFNSANKAHQPGTVFP